MSEQRCCRGLVVEGVPASGKTTLIRQMRKGRRLAQMPQTSIFIIGEQITQRVLEPAYNRGELDCTDHIQHMKSIMQPIVQFSSLLAARGWQDASEHHCIFLLERFHLTHAVYYPYVKWDDVASIDDCLHRLGARLVVLTADEKALRDRLFAGRSAGWLKYIRRYGNSRSEIVEHYLRRQSHLLDVARLSRLAVKKLDTSFISPSNLAGEVMDFWLG